MKIVIIGGGPGGYEAAIYAAKRGAQAILVEKGNVGGTCLNVGCIPTKALLAASDTYKTVQKAKDFSIAVQGEVRADYAGVVARKDKVVRTLVSGVEMTLEKNGVNLIRGVGRIVDKNTVRVEHMAGDAYMDVACDAIIIATGSVPAVPRFLPVDGDKIITSNELLSLTERPASMIIVGGGVIGCEIGQFLGRMGTEVTIVEMLPHVLPPEDEDVAGVLARSLKKDKIKAITGNGIVSVEVLPEGVKAVLTDGKELQAEKLLAAVGRRAYTEGLGLEAVGLAVNEKGCIAVDCAMRTAAEGIYAIGDVVDSLQLAHVAAKEGFVAVDTILGTPAQMEYHAVPRCVYTDPEVATVGATERELQEKGIAYKAGRFDYIANGKAKTAGKTDGFCKVLVDEKDVILGAAIVGYRATDMLQVLTMAVQAGMMAKQVGDAIFPHPTLSEIVMEALHDVHGMSVHKV